MSISMAWRHSDREGQREVPDKGPVRFRRVGPGSSNISSKRVLVLWCKEEHNNARTQHAARQLGISRHKRRLVGAYCCQRLRQQHRSRRFNLPPTPPPAQKGRTQNTKNWTQRVLACRYVHRPPSLAPQKDVHKTTKLDTLHTSKSAGMYVRMYIAYFFNSEHISHASNNYCHRGDLGGKLAWISLVLPLRCVCVSSHLQVHLGL